MKKSFSFFIGNNRESDRILAISARKRISNGSLWNESTAITKDVFLTLMEINQTDLAYVRHQFLFIAHLSTKWKKPCLPWTDFHLGLCSVQFECLRVLINARLHGWLLYVSNNESSSSAARYLHTIRQSQWKACHTISKPNET